MTKKVFVTGSTSGIGKAIYDGYFNIKEGYSVYGMGRTSLNFTDDEQVNAFLETDIPEPDILVNCAGFMDLNEDENVYLDLWKVNFLVPYLLIRKFIHPDLVVVNIASVSGMVADPDTPVYGALKAALISLTSSLAKKYAPMGARINCISPGFYNTNLVPEPTPQELLDTVPLGKREGDPSDMFEAVRFIEQAEYMTGANLVLDGGLTCKI